MNRFQKMAMEEITAWWIFRQLDGEPCPRSPSVVFSWAKHVRNNREKVEKQLLADYGNHREKVKPTPKVPSTDDRVKPRLLVESKDPPNKTKKSGD